MTFFPSDPELCLNHRDGDVLVENYLVANALHVYSLFRRCLHFVDTLMLVLEARADRSEKKDTSKSLSRPKEPFLF